MRHGKFCQLSSFRLILIAVLANACHLASAQTVSRQIIDDVKQQTKFGGYVIGQMGVNNQDGASKHSDMTLRLIRAYVDGRVLNVAYKFQFQLSGMPNKENGPRVLDAWAEWQHWKGLRIKFGQMKRPFTFENPMHPWNIGFGAYSQLSIQLAGFNDRVGERASNGRDFGLQLQGDLFPSQHDGHRWLHYQIGLFNGQGINKTDANSHKDLIGGIWFAPIEDLQIGAFGWTGNYQQDGITVDRNRYAFGLNYIGNRAIVRAEFAVSEGHKISDYIGNNGQRLDTPIGSDGADAWYVALGLPVAHRTKVWAKWDVFRDAKTWGSAHQQYTLSAEYHLHPNMMLQGNYSFNHDLLSSDLNYHAFDLQLYWRF